MNIVIGFGVLSILLLGAILIFKYKGQSLCGDEPSSMSVLVAILFTSGLDGGFILLPLVEYPQYITDSDFHFTNPLAVEIGFWGITAWAMYFVSTLYFLTVEPKLQLFQIPWVKKLSAVVVVATCAFTLSLFMQLMQQYLPVKADDKQMAASCITVVIVIMALIISTKTSLMTMVSKVSVIAFLLFVGYLAWYSQFNFDALVDSAVLAKDYIYHVHLFVIPFNDYHEFYLAWWITWSIMLGQFVAKFVSKMKPLKLFFVMTVLPMLPSFIWFSVLYHLMQNGVEITLAIQVVMLMLGCAFVINSIDFMVANYSQVFNVSLARLGKVKFITYNTIILIVFTYMFQEQLVFVQTSATLVIAIVYLLLGFMFYCRRKQYVSPLNMKQQNRAS